MKKDLTGQRFGRWLVLKRDDSKTKYPYWICQCDCGKVVSVYGSSLTGGKSLSCGCRSSELKRAAHTTHGQYGTPLYKVYYGMLGRCYCKKHIDYKWYNQKGITVCVTSGVVVLRRSVNGQCKAGINTVLQSTELTTAKVTALKIADGLHQKNKLRTEQQI